MIRIYSPVAGSVDVVAAGLGVAVKFVTPPTCGAGLDPGGCGEGVANGIGETPGRSGNGETLAIG